jgi:siroheme synthase-like protein
MPNTYLPIGLSLKSRLCLVVGGGQVALRKIHTLLDYDSDITVIEPKPVEKIEYYAKKGKVKLERREYQSPEAQSYGIVISASDDAEVNKAVYEDCQTHRIPVNVVDNPALCDFIFPAVLKRDCLTVAVSTDGKAPFLSGHLRLILEGVFPERWSRLVKLAVEFRKKVQRQWKGQPEQKTAAFERFLSADWQTLLKDEDKHKIEQQLEKLLLGGAHDNGSI